MPDAPHDPAEEAALCRDALYFAECGLSLPEIAHHFRISLAAAGSRIERARQERCQQATPPR